MRTLQPVFVTLALLASATFAATGPVKEADLLARSRAVYAGLTSYEDSGAVISEFGTSSREEHRFTTRFSRAPRGFLFDFRKAGGDRYVIWGDPDAFHVWWKATGVGTDYPNPNNSGAIALADTPTLGSALKIPALLYAKSALPAPFLYFAPVPPSSQETLNGRQCYVLSGSTHDFYGASGAIVNVRNMHVWIDAETLLIRKIVEEWPPLPGQVNRRTTLLEPRANPVLPAGELRFSPEKPN